MAEGQHRLHRRAVQSGGLTKPRDIAQVVGWIDQFGQNEPDIIAYDRPRRQFPAFDHVAPDEISLNVSLHEV